MKLTPDELFLIIDDKHGRYEVESIETRFPSRSPEHACLYIKDTNDDEGKTFYCVDVVRDIQGNLYVKEKNVAERFRKHKIVEEKTNDGKVVFREVSYEWDKEEED